MPQPMTPAPPASTKPLEAVDAVVRLLRGLGQGVVEPVMGYPTDPWGMGTRAALAGAKSLLPWRGTYEEERQKLKEQDEARWPGITSVMPEVQKDALVRAIKGDAAGMVQPAMIIGHASPHKWTGRPSWAAKGFGQGAATWGEAAAYASVPENFGPHGYPHTVFPDAPGSFSRGKGTDWAYREALSGGPEIGDLKFNEPLRLRRHDPKGSTNWWASLLAGTDNPEKINIPENLRADLQDMMGGMPALASKDELQNLLIEALRGRKLMRARYLLNDRLKATQPEEIALRREWARIGLDELRAARGLTGIELREPGSFHVWDLPDDAKIINQFDLLEQHPDLKEQVLKRYGPRRIRAVVNPETRLKDLIQGDLAELTPTMLRDLGYDATKYYGEQNFTFGGSNPVQNYTILNPDKIEPLGTFNTALDFWRSPLAEELWPRIQKEMAERLRERKLLFGPGAK